MQRVSSANVRVGGEASGEIGDGLMILLGVGREDTPGVAAALAEKTANLRIFEDENGKMNRSLLDVKGGALVVSQFTLYGDARGGRRPSFIAAAPPEQAKAQLDSMERQARLVVSTLQSGAKANAVLRNVRFGDERIRIVAADVEDSSKLDIRVATGIFQAMMSVELVNEGPVTILLDSDKTF